MEIALLALTNGVCIALIVLLIWQTYQEGHIFEFVSKWGKDNLSEKLQKPIFNCPICMCPWYGTIIWFILLDSPANLGGYIASIFVAAGINTIIAHHFLHDD